MMDVKLTQMNSVTARTKISPLLLPGVKYVSSTVAAYPLLRPVRKVYEKLGFCFVLFMRVKYCFQSFSHENSYLSIKLFVGFF